jgi:hypothetical protein
VVVEGARVFAGPAAVAGDAAGCCGTDVGVVVVEAVGEAVGEAAVGCGVADAGSPRTVSRPTVKIHSSATAAGSAGRPNIERIIARILPKFEPRTGEGSIVRKRRPELMLSPRCVSCQSQPLILNAFTSSEGPHRASKTTRYTLGP